MDDRRPGEPYAVPHLEWFVECAEPDCGAETTLAAVGMTTTATGATAAAMRLQTFGMLPGWALGADDKWRCPQHALP